MKITVKYKCYMVIIVQQIILRDKNNVNKNQY